MGKTFEYVISHVGGFGRFQLYMVCAVFGQKFFAGWSMMQMAFAGIIPDFHCITDDNTTTSALYAFHNGTETTADVNETQRIDTLNKCSVNGSVCIEYHFETSIRGAINEWDLVCDLSWVKATTTSVQMAGVLLGAVLSGQLGDMYGRKKTCYGFYLFHIVCNLAIMFSNSWQLFMAFRFLIGMGIGSILVMCLPYPIEFVPENRRAVIPVIPMWSFGVCSFAFAGYLLEDWIYLHLACAVVSAPMLLGWFFVPESIRWLTVKGRTEEAYSVFEKMASVNGKTLPDDTIQVIQIVADEEKRIREKGANYSYIDIFRGQGMVLNTVSFAFMWCSLSLVFYGLGFGVSGLGGNVYFNLFLLYALDIPTILSSFFFSNRFGRRKTAAMFFFIGAVAGFGAMATELTEPESNKDVILTVLTLVSKCSVGAAWTTCQSWVIEVYPTVTRNLGYGFANMCARVGGIIAPFAIDLDSRLVLSYTLIGAFLLTSAILAVICKETKGMALADSMTINVTKPTASKVASTKSNDSIGETTTVDIGKNSSNGINYLPHDNDLYAEARREKNSSDLFSNGKVDLLKK